VPSKIAKRSILISGRKTSVSLEEEFWQAFKRIARQRQVLLGELVATVKRQKHSTNLSSAIRLFVLNHFQSK